MPTWRSDRWVRTNGIPQKAAVWASQQSSEFGPLIRAFADGLNAWATEHPAMLSAAAKAVLPLTAEDVYAHGLRIIHYDWLTSENSVYAKAATRGRRDAWIERLGDRAVQNRRPATPCS